MELHVKNLVHTFEIGGFMGHFYVDDDKEEISYTSILTFKRIVNIPAESRFL